MFCCAASTGENPCVEVCAVLGLATIPVSVNGTAVAGSGVTAAAFRGTPALLEGTMGFSEPTAVVPVGIAVLFAALPAGEAVAALPAAFGGGVTALPAAPCGETDTLDAGAFFWLFA